MKVLTLDIETSPMLAHVWGLWDQNVGLNQLVTPTRVICFAAKWLDEPKVLFYSEHHDGHAEMVAAAWRLLDEADVVVHFNGQRFDIPHLNREFATAGLTPPSPYVQVDLLLAARRRFKFPSNKLQYVSTALGLAGKAHHEGFDLWKKCLAGDPKAWAQMKRYNKQDVRVTEDLYLVLLPWLPNHPSRRLYDGVGGCPTCGSDRLRRKGYAYTKLSKFQRYQCRNCGSQFRDSKRVEGVDVQRVVS